MNPQAQSLQKHSGSWSAAEIKIKDEQATHLQFCELCHEAEVFTYVHLCGRVEFYFPLFLLLAWKKNT